MSQVPNATKDVGQATVEVGRVFGAGGADGLILYASVLSAFFLFLTLGLTLWLNHRERTARAKDQLDQSSAFATAADKSAEAMKELATAIASAASADMTFKQTMVPMLEAMDRRMQTVERDLPPRTHL